MWLQSTRTDRKHETPKLRNYSLPLVVYHRTAHVSVLGVAYFRPHEYQLLGKSDLSTDMGVPTVGVETGHYRMLNTALFDNL